MTRCICPVDRGAFFFHDDNTGLVGLRFVSEDQPLGCEFAIKALVFRPFKTLHCLGAKVLRLGDSQSLAGEFVASLFKGTPQAGKTHQQPRLSQRRHVRGCF